MPVSQDQRDDLLMDEDLICCDCSLQHRACCKFEGEKKKGKKRKKGKEKKKKAHKVFPRDSIRKRESQKPDEQPSKSSGAVTALDSYLFLI